MSKWISVEDRLPDKYEWVLVYENYCDVPFIGYYDSVDKKWELETSYIDIIGDAYREDNITQENVTHWQTLPEPPVSE